MNPAQARTAATGGQAEQATTAGEIRIARARLADLPAMARLQRRGFALDRGYGLATCFALWLARRPLLLLARTADAPNGALAGMVIADLRPGPAPTGRILNLCVAPEHRRRGHGRALLRAAEALLPARAWVLMVDQKNHGAIALYESLGYRNVGLEPDYYGRHRHALVMQKTRG